jgi:hypothetical protein
MKVKLADRLATTVKATGPQTEYFDEALTGLALQVTPTVKARTNHATLEGKRLRGRTQDLGATGEHGSNARRSPIALTGSIGREKLEELAGGANALAVRKARELLERRGPEAESPARRRPTREPRLSRRGV